MLRLLEAAEAADEVCRFASERRRAGKAAEEGLDSTPLDGGVLKATLPPLLSGIETVIRGGEGSAESI